MFVVSAWQKNGVCDTCHQSGDDTSLVSCHVTKSVQLIWRSGTRRWTSTGTQSSNKLQRLDLKIEHQDVIPSNDSPDDMADCFRCPGYRGSSGCHPWWADARRRQGYEPLQCSLGYLQWGHAMCNRLHILSADAGDQWSLKYAEQMEIHRSQVGPALWCINSVVPRSPYRIIIVRTACLKIGTLFVICRVLIWSVSSQFHPYTSDQLTGTGKTIRLPQGQCDNLEEHS